MGGLPTNSKTYSMAFLIKSSFFSVKKRGHTNNKQRLSWPTIRKTFKSEEHATCGSWEDFQQIVKLIAWHVGKV